MMARVECNRRMLGPGRHADNSEYTLHDSRVTTTNQSIHTLIFDESLVEPRYRSQEDDSWSRPVVPVSGCGQWTDELFELTIN